MTVRSKAHLSVLGANILFGINYSVVKFLTSNFMHPWAMNMLRIAVSSLLLWMVYAFQRGAIGFKKKDAMRFVVCALIGVAVNQLLFTKGLSLTTSIHASLLALGTPIFITAIAAFVLNEKFTWNKAVGLALGIGGAALLILSRTSHANATAKDMLAGDTMVICNAICYAFYFVWVKPLMDNYKAMDVLRWTFTIGAFFILPFGWPPLMKTDWTIFTTQAWLALGFAVVGATFFSYLLNIYGLKILGPGVAGSYIYTQPVFASVIGMIFLGEPLGVIQIVSALLIGVGVFVVNKRKEQPAVVNVAEG